MMVLLPTPANVIELRVGEAFIFFPQTLLEQNA
jgi:hypothetical protein